MDFNITQPGLTGLLKTCGLTDPELTTYVSEFFRVPGVATVEIFCQEYTRMKNLNAILLLRKARLKKTEGRNDPMPREEILELFKEAHSEDDAATQVEALFLDKDPDGKKELTPMAVLEWFRENFHLRNTEAKRKIDENAPASKAQDVKGQDSSSEFKTPYGVGKLVTRERKDGMVELQLPFGVCIIQESQTVPIGSPDGADKESKTSSPTPQQDGPAPQAEGSTPEQAVASPQADGPTPEQGEAAPQPDGPTPEEKAASSTPGPEAGASPEQKAVPQADGPTPGQAEATPQPDGSTPEAEATPQPAKDTPQPDGPTTEKSEAKAAK